MAALIGQLAAVVHHHPDLRPTELYIDELAVAPSFQRQGIARRLVDAAFELARALGCRELWRRTREPDNLPARSLYEARGAPAEPVVMYVYKLSLAVPANSSRLPSGSRTMKVRAPHGSCFSGRKKSTPAAWNSANRARISAALPTVVEAAEKLLTLAYVVDEDWSADEAQVQQRLAAADLAVERRLAVGEDDLEAELVGIERARRLEVGDEQVGFGRVQRGRITGMEVFVSVVMACTPALSACQLSNPAWRATSS